MKKRLKGITAKTLSNKLKDLEKKGIIKICPYNEIPPRVNYSLIYNGKRLMKALLPLIHWSEHKQG